MIAILTIAVMLLTLAVLAFGLWLAEGRRWHHRAERARIDREIGRAEHRLHNLTSNAFASMLEAARGKSSDGEWRR